MKCWVSTSGVGQILPAVWSSNGNSPSALRHCGFSCAARRLSFYGRSLGCVTAAHQSGFCWGTNGREIYCVNNPTASPLQEFLTTPTQRRYRSSSALRPVSTSSSSSFHLWGAWIKPWAVNHTDINEHHFKFSHELNLDWNHWSRYEDDGWKGWLF